VVGILHFVFVVHSVFIDIFRVSKQTEVEKPLDDLVNCPKAERQITDLVTRLFRIQVVHISFYVERTATHDTVRASLHSVTCVALPVPTVVSAGGRKGAHGGTAEMQFRSQRRERITYSP
jgi:hypothetical protein